MKWRYWIFRKLTPPMNKISSLLDIIDNIPEEEMGNI